MGIKNYLNKIICGDCSEVMKTIPDNSVDLIITSPPYADMKRYDNFNGVSPDKYIRYIIPKIKEIERIMKISGSFILNINDKVVKRFRHPYVFQLIAEIYKQTNLKLFERLFWNKGKYLPNKSRFGDKIEYLFWFTKSKNFYFNINKMRVPYDSKSLKRMRKPIKKRFCRTIQNQNTTEYKEWEPNKNGALPSTLITVGSESRRVSDIHIAVYPVKLVEYFVKGSTKENDIVLDPFIGSGTTAIACKNLNRKFIGIDISEKYCKIARERLSK